MQFLNGILLVVAILEEIIQQHFVTYTLPNLELVEAIFKHPHTPAKDKLLLTHSSRIGLALLLGIFDIHTINTIHDFVCTLVLKSLDSFEMSASPIAGRSQLRNLCKFILVYPLSLFEFKIHQGRVQQHTVLRGLVYLQKCCGFVL